MKSFVYVITDKEGIHARPAGVVVAEAKKYASVISIENKGKKADIKRIFGVMGLCVKCGEEVKITAEGADFTEFMTALNTVTVHLCRMIAGDGEGATKLLECKVSGASDLKTARMVAKSVICSSLLKAAMFGADANWGRVLCAIGYSGADVDVNAIDVDFRSAAGTVAVCRNGAGVPFSEEKASEVLKQKEIEILVSLGDGPVSATAWGCDLTYDYVKINGDYRT